MKLVGFLWERDERETIDDREQKESWEKAGREPRERAEREQLDDLCQKKNMYMILTNDYFIEFNININENNT